MISEETTITQSPDLTGSEDSAAIHISHDAIERALTAPRNGRQKRLTHAMSFDVEDWFHLVGIKSVANPDQWASYPTLVEANTDWFLETLQRYQVRATFFIVGWVAQRYPGMVKRIADAGHEIGSHSYWHRGVYELDPFTFREDLRRSIDVLEAISGKRVLGFRAPSFSIKPGYEWAFDVMHDCGIVYDASLFPASRGQGGYLCPREIHEFNQVPSGRPMPEIPMSVMDFMGKRLPFSGGGYVRILPWWLINKGFQQLEARRRPAVVYLHPRDFAPDCPRVPMPPHRKFKCYVGLGSTRQKLLNMLERYRFATCASVMGIEETEQVAKAA